MGNFQQSQYQQGQKGTTSLQPVKYIMLKCGCMLVVTLRPCQQRDSGKTTIQPKNIN